MDFDGLHVVVTGGTGTLGQAVVAALIGAGATCHIPYRSEFEAERFPLRDHAQAKLYPNCELGDESSVDRLFERVPAPWASVHLAGGFAFGPLSSTLAKNLPVHRAREMWNMGSFSTIS